MFSWVLMLQHPGWCGLCWGLTRGLPHPREPVWRPCYQGWLGCPKRGHGCPGRHHGCSGSGHGCPSGVELVMGLHRGSPMVVKLEVGLHEGGYIREHEVFQGGEASDGACRFTTKSTRR